MHYLEVSNGAILEIKSLLAQRLKIHAIKRPRAETGCGLRVAKRAVEFFSGEATPTENDYVIGPHFRIKNIELETADGTVTVDMEELKLKFHMTLPQIGFQKTSELMTLIDFIDKWQGTSAKLND